MAAQVWELEFDPFCPENKVLFSNDSAPKFVAQRYNRTPGNLGNWMKTNGIRKSRA